MKINAQTGLILAALAVAAYILTRKPKVVGDAGTGTGYGSPYLLQSETLLPGGAAEWFEYKKAEPFSLVRPQ